MAPERGDDTAFMGKLTAGAAHELKNVLAIVGESAGLLEDLLQLPGCREFSHRDRFLKALTSIRDQVRRGTQILTQLNKFAHGADHEKASVRLFDLMENLKALSDRFLRQKAITLDLVPDAKTDVAVETFPVALQRLLFHALKTLVEVLPQGAVVVGEIGRKGTQAVCRLVVQGAPLSDGALQTVEHFLKEDGMRTLLQRLSATAQAARDGLEVRLGAS